MTRQGLGWLWRGSALFLLAANTALPAAGPPAKSSKQPWERLQGEDERKANQIQQQIDTHWEASDFEQALKRAKELLALRQKVQGAGHWETINARWRINAIQNVLKQPLTVRREMA